MECSVTQYLGNTTVSQSDGDDDAKPTVNKQLHARQGELFAVLEVQSDSEDALTELRDVEVALAYAKAGC